MMNFIKYDQTKQHQLKTDIDWMKKGDLIQAVFKRCILKTQVQSKGMKQRYTMHTVSKRMLEYPTVLNKFISR